MKENKSIYTVHLKYLIRIKTFTDKNTHRWCVHHNML